jgi:mannose-6-phosphate isomerase-like protein (cupin superfamily)
VKAGDVLAFDSQVPHQLWNDGDEPLVVFSVFWKPAAAR